MLSQPNYNWSGIRCKYAEISSRIPDVRYEKWIQRSFKSCLAKKKARGHFLFLISQRRWPMVFNITVFCLPISSQTIPPKLCDSYFTSFRRSALSTIFYIIIFFFFAIFVFFRYVFDWNFKNHALVSCTEVQIVLTIFHSVLGAGQ